MSIVNLSTATTPDIRAAEETRLRGKRVLQTEAAALAALADALDHRFDQAVRLIAAAKGRVIVTGMGKNGHVGHKVAATMASTGTPAFFVHPAEASHGDMGMIMRDDVVLALSNSGETRELADLIAYTRRFAIPLIAITSNPESTLGQRADVVLLLPPVGEACPNGLAPTTSTTLTMALGDALAISLLEQKGFTAKDFRVFHPGGKLGQQLMRVSEIMHGRDTLPLVPPAMPIPDVIKVMAAAGFGSAIITHDDGTLAGIITDGDIRRNLSDKITYQQAQDIMSKTPVTATPDMLVGEAMAIMNDLKNNKRKITALIVVDDAQKPVGLLHIHDCLRAGFA